MKPPTLHDKVLALYIENDQPKPENVKRCIETYLHKKYNAKKLNRIYEDIMKRHDFEREAVTHKSKKRLSGYIDSITAARLRESYKSSGAFDLDSLDELKFKALVKQVISHFGYETLYTPPLHGQCVDFFVHRKNAKIAVYAIKSTGGSGVGVNFIRQMRYIANYYNCEQVLLVSSAYFSPDEANEASKANIILLDRDKFLPLVQDLIDNRHREEKELLSFSKDSNNPSIYMDGEIKFPKSKVQVAYIKYFIDDTENALCFEGKLCNSGKKPVRNLTIDLKLYDRSGEVVCAKNFKAEKDTLESLEESPFKLVLHDIPEVLWKNLCRYVLKLEYSNVYKAD